LPSLLKASPHSQAALRYHSSTTETSSHQQAGHNVHHFKEYMKQRG